MYALAQQRNARRNMNNYQLTVGQDLPNLNVSRLTTSCQATGFSMISDTLDGIIVSDPLTNKRKIRLLEDTVNNSLGIEGTE